MNNSRQWANTVVADDETHHTLDGKAIYKNRFKKVLKFHAPGLAPAENDKSAYHINIFGERCYKKSFSKTFGFYENLAAVCEQNNGWYHINPDGIEAYSQRFKWCGNFQGNCCVVQDDNNRYFHITKDGQSIYSDRYNYVGDFKDGIAVVWSSEGLCTHIDSSGNYIHGEWYKDLDIYHKGYARAKDCGGWFHINKKGKAIYKEKYKNIEPYYNGRAKIETTTGEFDIINTKGIVEHIIHNNSDVFINNTDKHNSKHAIIDKSQIFTLLEEDKTHSFSMVSAEIVSYWKTQVIKSAVDLELFKYLPSTVEKIANKIGVDCDIAKRLLRALMEIKLITKENNLYLITETSQYLDPKHELSLVSAVHHWAGENYIAWMGLTESLQSGKANYEKFYSFPIFDWLDEDETILRQYHKAMTTYATHDYPSLLDKLDLSSAENIIDAAGGQGVVIKKLLTKYPKSRGVLLERPTVVNTIEVPNFLIDRMDVLSFDLFKSWPVYGDVVILSRILHDWNDQGCKNILQQTYQSVTTGGKIIVIEMLLSENDANGGLLDLNMLVITGGKERTFAEIERLMNDSGFLYSQTTNYNGLSAIEFIKKPNV